MTDKELKRLSRAELLEMLLKQSQNAEKLAARLERAKELLGERQLKLDHAGSIAEASLQLNGVFEAAQESVRQYLESIEALEPAQKQALLTEQKEAEHMERMKEMVDEAQRQCDELRTFTFEQCQKEIAAAKEQVQKEWESIPRRLEDFGKENEQYRDLIAAFLEAAYGAQSITDAESTVTGCRSEDGNEDEEEREADSE